MWQGTPEVFSFGEELPPSFLLKMVLLIPARVSACLAHKRQVLSSPALPMLWQ
jgi:hypothetical protein